MRKAVFSFFVFSVLLYADIASRHLMLPEKSWEVSLLYIQSDDSTGGAYLPFRYGISKRLEFIPFGVKYLAFDAEKNKIALLGYLSQAGYGSMNGWGYEAHVGMVWRNLATDQWHIDLSPKLLYGHSEIEEKKGGALALTSVYTFTRRFEAGVGVSFYKEEKQAHYERINHLNPTVTTGTQLFKSGLFLYYFFTENIDLKAGIYAVREEETHTPAESTTETNAFLYRLDWRF